MQPALTRCPVCQGELTVTRLHCPSCDTAVEGRFTAGLFASLSTEQLQFVEIFLRSEGKLSRMEQEVGLSYPTLRNRLHEIIRALGFEPGKDDTPDVSDEKRLSVLEDLDAGRISADAAMRILKGEEE